MEHKNKLEEMLNQLSILLDFVDSQSGKIINPENITPDVLKQLDQLEIDFQKFVELSDKVIELTGTTKELVAEGMKEFEELAKLAKMAEAVMGAVDPGSPESLEQRREAEKKIGMVDKEVPENALGLLHKANQLKARTDNMLKSISSDSSDLFSETSQVEFTEDDENKITDKAFRARRRRHLKNFGGDKV